MRGTGTGPPLGESGAGGAGPGAAGCEGGGLGGLWALRAHPPRCGFIPLGAGRAVLPPGSSAGRGSGEVAPIRRRHFIISVQVFPGM